LVSRRTPLGEHFDESTDKPAPDQLVRPALHLNKAFKKGADEATHFAVEAKINWHSFRMQFT
jgi:hypothetical protein